ncbi:unnamed protein product [Polarella glacialis]|uniref:Uncharacterized protein n=1 Tax=Polarella glacialis TaxID=89957 RepID=A0A813HLA4_POLGL|nr:unnamed protein product [Polarella glacialis]
MEQVMDHDQTNRQRPEPLASVSVLGSSLQDSLVLTLATESSTADMMLSQLISPLAGGPDTLDAGGLGLPAPFRSPASPSSVAMGPEAVQVLEAAVDAAGSDCFCWTGTEDEHLVTTLSMADKVESPEPWEPLLTSTLTGIIDGALVSRRTVEDLDRAADSLVVSSASGRGSADGRDIQEAVTVEGMSSSRKEEELEKEKRGNLLPLPPEGVERARSSREQRRDSRTEEEAALAAAMMAEPEATQGSLSSPEELATTLIITVEEEGPCHLGKRPVSSEPPAAAPGSAADTADAADAAANAAGAADAGTSEPPASAAGAADAAAAQRQTFFKYVCLFVCCLLFIWPSVSSFCFVGLLFAADWAIIKSENKNENKTNNNKNKHSNDDNHNNNNNTTNNNNNICTNNNNNKNNNNNNNNKNNNNNNNNSNNNNNNNNNDSSNNYNNNNNNSNKNKNNNNDSSSSNIKTTRRVLCAWLTFGVGSNLLALLVWYVFVVRCCWLLYE